MIKLIISGFAYLKAAKKGIQYLVSKYYNDGGLKKILLE
jgi:hypothetical protein